VLSPSSLKPRQNIPDPVTTTLPAEVDPRDPQPLHLARCNLEPSADLNCCKRRLRREIPEGASRGPSFTSVQVVNDSASSNTTLLSARWRIASSVG